MKHPSESAVFTIVALFACSWTPCAAASGAPDAAAELDVTMTVLPDDDAVANAMARVIALPAQASARAQERAQRGIDTANQAVEQGGLGHDGAAQGGVEIDAEGGNEVGVDNGLGADVAAGAEVTTGVRAPGVEAGVAADTRIGADTGAAPSGEGVTLRERIDTRIDSDIRARVRGDIRDDIRERIRDNLSDGAVGNPRTR